MWLWIVGPLLVFVALILLYELGDILQNVIGELVGDAVKRQTRKIVAAAAGIGKVIGDAGTRLIGVFDRHH
jgi:hypothetical protein